MYPVTPIDLRFDGKGRRDAIVTEESGKMAKTKNEKKRKEKERKKWNKKRNDLSLIHNKHTLLYKTSTDWPTDTRICMQYKMQNRHGIIHDMMIDIHEGGNKKVKKKGKKEIKKDNGGKRRNSIEWENKKKIKKKGSKKNEKEWTLDGRWREGGLCKWGSGNVIGCAKGVHDWLDQWRGMW
jgi:hypothetical protein